MDIKHLVTFNTAAENLNFTLTSKLLNFAQSSVTAHIKALEEELGIRLFERLGKRIVLTEEGRKFKEYSEKIVELSQEAKLVINDHTETAKTIIIGAQESQCTYRLPPILAKFKSHFPEVKVIFQPAHSDTETKDRLINGKLDIAFIMDVPKPSTVISVEPLIKERMIMVASNDHPLLANPNIELNDLKNETLLLTEMGCSYRTILEESFRMAGVYPSNKFEFVSIEPIKQCVISGIGIALLPAMAVEREIIAGQMKELAWNSSIHNIHTQIAWHKDKWIPPHLGAFIEITREVFKAEQLRFNERQ